MALLPMGPPTTDYRTEHAGFEAGDRQESMFDEPTAFAAAGYETHYEATEDGEGVFEPADDVSGEVPELVSYQSGSGHAAIDPLEEPSAGGPEPAGEVGQDVAPEPAAPEAPPAASATMLTANDFAALEERVLRAVALVRSERQARVAAEERVAAMEGQLHSFEAQIQQIEAQSPILERLVQEVETLRLEREQVRQRVERLLGQLDALEL